MNWVRRNYVGRPYEPGADGPTAFSCWGLVRHVFRTQAGVDMPMVAVHTEEAAAADNVGAIKKAARVSGMRPVVDGSPPQSMDIVVMYGVGTLHCGVVVKVNGRLHVLHAAHEAGVVCEPWQHATQGLSVELWRQIK